ncbi:MAG: hypothetical protein EAZ99_14850 [Alphaproteobacteria bacterium]|nr:MAG: hypothetical protein EAZ99_14850 [Alphaproteobacteria bacterium]
MTRLFAVALLVLLTACNQWTLVNPGPTNIRSSLQLSPTIAFNQRAGALPAQPTETWTLDGPLLNRVWILPGIPEGRPLVVAPSTFADPNARPFPAIKPTMNETEMMELIADTISIDNGQVALTTENLRPTTFSGQPGFRFDFQFAGRNELRYRGSFVGAMIDGKLFGVMLTATSLHHYQSLLPEFERLAASARRLTAAS